MPKQQDLALFGPVLARSMNFTATATLARVAVPANLGTGTSTLATLLPQ